MVKNCYECESIENCKIQNIIDYACSKEGMNQRHPDCPLKATKKIVMTVSKYEYIQKQLKNTIAKDKYESRKALKQIHIMVTEKDIIFESCDGYVAARYIESNNGDIEPFYGIIPIIQNLSKKLDYPLEIERVEDNIIVRYTDENACKIERKYEQEKKDQYDNIHTSLNNLFNENKPYIVSMSADRLINVLNTFKGQFVNIYIGSNVEPMKIEAAETTIPYSKAIILPIRATNNEKIIIKTEPKKD